MNRMSGHKLVALLLAAVLIASIILISLYKLKLNKPEQEIKVGVFDEPDILDAELLAIEELNNKNGVLGYKILPVMLSSHNLALVEKKILEDNLKALFGCMSLECRKNLIPIINKHNILLFTPGSYSIELSSPFIISTSAAPNQQVIPAVSWAITNLGLRAYIVGSQLKNLAGIEQAVIAEYVKDVVFAHDGYIVGESYISADKSDAEKAAQKIAKIRPNIIINLLTGQDNVVFFDFLRAKGISSEKIPTMSLNITEMELANFNLDQLSGDYATQNYFQNIDTPSNREFVSRFKNKFGKNRYINNPMENAYIGVHFWRLGATQAQSFNADPIRDHVSTQALAAPEGIISIDKNTLHCWKPALVGRIFPNKQFGLVFDSVSTIQPLRNEKLKTDKEWQRLLVRWRSEFRSKP